MTHLLQELIDKLTTLKERLDAVIPAAEKPLRTYSQIELEEGKNINGKTTIVKQYTKSPIDLELIKKIAGNANLTTEEIFQFPTFIIARSGLNRNHSDITPEGQRAAAKDWVGKSNTFP